MKSAARRLAPLWAGAWMTLLASGLVAPTPALAVCNPLAVMHGHDDGSAGLRQNDLTILSEARLRGDAASFPLPSDRPRPCRGLSCSKAPLPPVAPTVPVGPQRAELWACVEGPRPQPDPRSLARWDEHSAGRAVHRAFPPDRPPRSA